jgi:exopolysaccharide biosynthesis polyprenyl glycosylphosphotransferase
MDLFHRRALNQGFKLLDLTLVALAFALSFAAGSFPEHFHSIAHILSIRVTVLNCALSMVLIAAWHGCFSMVGLYQARRAIGLLREAVDVALGATLAALLLAGWGILFRIEIVDTTLLLSYWIASVGMLMATRLVIQVALRHLRMRGRNLRLVLVVGTNPRAARTADYIRSDPHLGYRLVGFVDDPWDGGACCEPHGKVVARLDEFPAYLRDNVVDEVVICLPMRSYYREQQKLVDMCEKLGVTVRFPTDLFESRRAAEVEQMLTVYQGSAHPVPMFFKRTIDFMVASLLLAVLAPSFAIIALVVRFTSPGGVFFIQERIGLHRRRFPMFKFRTMYSGAEQRLLELAKQNEVAGPVFKIRNDPRITPLGRFLRRTSLDELPQLLNVVRGEMSLVGPRPLPVRDYKGFTEDWHRRRFSVRPGLTCLWQVSGRSSIGFEQWMELDMCYIDNWSLWLDLKILARTVPAIIRGRGAA